MPRRPVRLVLLLAVFALVAAGVGTLLGVIPGLSALAGRAHPEDLGIRYSTGDLASALDALADREGELEATLSEAEVSAYLVHVTATTETPFRDVQVRLQPDNRFEASGMIRYEGREYPVYLTGTAHVQGASATSSTLSALKIAGLPVPADFRERVEASIEEAVDGLLKEVTGLDVARLETSEGSLRVVGRQG